MIEVFAPIGFVVGLVFWFGGSDQNVRAFGLSGAGLWASLWLYTWWQARRNRLR